MSYSSGWEEIAGDIEGVNIEPKNGKHNPPWGELDERVQGVITEVCRGAEQIIEELCITGKDDEERRFAISSKGHYNLDGGDQASTVQITIIETTKGGASSGT
jgi:hypothetical protein